ncbi:hypothetical protein ACH5RR_008634 [Cinchona calisaya]|uniref:Uncharacterized protein n=1 Tax=Cinchona calisaya TaxID=153742 RepID=A0ABD3AEW1_9GENT
MFCFMLFEAPQRYGWVPVSYSRKTINEVLGTPIVDVDECGQFISRVVDHLAITCDLCPAPPVWEMTSYGSAYKQFHKNVLPLDAQSRVVADVDDEVIVSPQAPFNGA